MTPKHKLIESRCRKMIVEGKMENAEASLAAKDLVDRLQDTIVEIGKMCNDELPHLIDSIRASFGAEAASKYQSTADEVLTSLLAAVKEHKTTLENATLVLTGDAAEGDLDSGLNLPDESEPVELPDLDDEDSENKPEALPNEKPPVKNPIGREKRIREAQMKALHKALMELDTKKFPKQARRLSEELNRLAVIGIKSERNKGK